MKILQDKRFSKAIQQNLEESPFFEYVQRVIDALKGEKVYFWGGAVRDPIVNVLYGLDYETRDFDLTINDSEKNMDFRKIFNGFEGVYYSRHGTPKWKPINGLEVDIGPFSAATIYRRQPKLPINLETALVSVDITTSAIAYDLKNKTIYSVEALEGIHKKEVNVLYEHGEEQAVIMCRLILHGNKLGFEIGQKGRKFIKERYSSNQDRNIKRYLEYKKLEGLSSFVIGRLKRIQQESRVD
jgi:tRNA nucleotidyltransferase/poly(A) polymerase